MSLVFDVYQFGATGNGTTDDRVAIQSAIDAAATAGGVVAFGRGTFLVSQAGTNSWCLRIPNGVRLVGAGRSATTLRMASAAASAANTTIYFLFANGRNTTIEHVSLDGNKPNPGVTAYSAALEHHPGIFVHDCANLLVNDCDIFNFTGDGIQVYAGTTDLTVFHTTIRTCNRNSVSLTHGGGIQNNIRLIASEFLHSANQQIDGEPAGTNILISQCRVDQSGQNGYAIGIGGVNPSSRTSGWSLVNNTINGVTNLTYADDVTISGNLITCDGAMGSSSAIYGYYNNNRISIVGNVIKQVDSTGSYSAAIRFTGVNGGGLISSTIVISGNVIDVSGSSSTAIGVIADGANDILVEGNQLIGTGTGTLGIGVRVRPSTVSDDFRAAVIRNNRFVNWLGFGVSLFAGTVKSLLSVDISGNSFDNTTGVASTAVSLDDGGASKAKSISMTGNVLLGSCTTLATTYPPGVPVLIGGNQGTNPVFSVSGSPEGLVTATAGAMAIDRSSTSGSCLYVKQTPTGSTGWVAK